MMQQALAVEPNMTVDELASRLEQANEAYRRGAPEMSDDSYDRLMLELAERAPDHRLLHRVEPESDFGDGKVRHRRPMLSTEKCYTHDELCRWLDRVEKAATELGMTLPVVLDVTPKLDGVAATYTDGVLATRGDGLTGNDISRMVRRGIYIGPRVEGPGEIVMRQSYFDAYLADTFENARNVVGGAISADTLDPLVQQALADQAIVFIPFAHLGRIAVGSPGLREYGVEEIREELFEGIPFLTDGLVIEVQDKALREHLGATSHHHRWMIAVKTIGETAITRVDDVTWQVGRTGRLTPVLNIDPVRLSGATISNVTGHHAGYLLKNGIGTGARLRVVRSGEVIPKVMETLDPTPVALPSNCPCCASDLHWLGDFLACSNEECADRIQARLEHFFSIIGTIDLFGPVACQKLVEFGVTAIADIFGLTNTDFEQMGFGAGQSRNLVREIEAARTRPVDDFRVLAALGIEHLGRGDSKRILKQHPLSQVSQLSACDIEAIEGFGALTSASIADGLAGMALEIAFLRTHFERIVETPRTAQAPTSSPISGKNIVFTGTMTQGSRDAMTAQAESLGAKAQSSVNGKTHFLVAGEKTGASKLQKAQQHGTTVLSEAEYLELIGA